MRRVIPPLPQYVFIAWCLVKHSDNSSFISDFKANWAVFMSYILHFILFLLGSNITGGVCSVNQNIRTANESLENVVKFKYLGTTLTNRNDIHDEIKSRLNSGNACYYSVQNLLSSRLISKKPKD
jgi:hypothetical protein